MAVMKSLTEAILECSGPERNLYQELSHEGEKAYAGSQSAGTVPDSRGNKGSRTGGSCSSHPQHISNASLLLLSSSPFVQCRI